MASPAKEIRILYMEDDPGIARLLQKRLERAGFSVDVAPDGEQGLAMFERGSYDMLAVDYKMPGKSGLEVMRRLSSQRRLPPTIMITGRGNEAVAAEAMRLGATDYIVKDIDSRYLELVQAAVVRALEIKRMKAEKKRADAFLEQVNRQLEQRTAELLETNKRLTEEIAERKRIESALIRAKQEWERTFDAVPDLIALIDTGFRTVRLNKAMADRLRLQMQDGVGTACYELLHSADCPLENCPHAAMMATGTEQTSEITEPKLGGTFLVTASPLFDAQGSLQGCVHVARDITAQKSAEDALRESESKFRSFFDTSLDGIVIVGLDGRIEGANRAYLDMLGYTLYEMRSMNYRDTTPEGWTALEDHIIRDQVMKRGYSDVYEKEFIRRDATTFPATVRTWLVKDADDRPLRLWGVVRDVTDRKRAELQAVQNERIKAVGEMAGGVAHNFNNLLQIVVGGVQMAATYIELGENERAKENLCLIMESAKWGAQTVKRLQDFARVRPEDPASSGKVFDLSLTLNEAVEMSKPWWKTGSEAQGIRIELRRDSKKDCLVKGKENELFEVIVNLIKNATEALPLGGVIQIGTSVKDDEVVLVVRDNGTGIEQQNLGRIFEPFWTTKGTEGTGMGLSSSFGIVKRHGGEISVESEVGTGTTFTVTLPHARKKISGSEVASGSEVLPNLRILVVDDIESVAAMLADGLRKLDQTVVTVLSGQDAITLFKKSYVDAVICDLAMPEINGRQVTAAIKRICEERGSRKPVIVLLTGWGGRFDHEESLPESGIDLILEKPVEVRDMLRSIVKVHKKRSDSQPKEW